MISANPNAYKQVVLISLESTNSLIIHMPHIKKFNTYKKSMPHVIFSHLYHNLFYTKMKFVDNDGGLKLISSTFEEFQSIYPQPLQDPIAIDLDIVVFPCSRSSKLHGK